MKVLEALNEDFGGLRREFGGLNNRPE